MEKDPDLHTFASGTRRSERSAPATLPEAFDVFKKGLRGMPYRRSPQEKNDAKRVSDRIMGERDDN
jgi:hypothetical protein